MNEWMKWAINRGPYNYYQLFRVEGGTITSMLGITGMYYEVTEEALGF